MTIIGIGVLALMYVFVTSLNIVAENVVSTFSDEETRVLILILPTLYANERVNIWHLEVMKSLLLLFAPLFLPLQDIPNKTRVFEGIAETKCRLV